MELMKSYGSIQKYQSLEEMGITGEQLRQEPDRLRINGVTYSCVYSHYETESSETANMTMVQMLPIVTLGMKSLNCALAVCYTLGLSFVTMVVYMFAVRRCVRETVLTKGQAKRYSPRKLRIRMICAAVTGAIAVFAVACTLQGIGQIYVETKYGLIAAGLYLIGAVVLLLILFRGYTQEAYEGAATVRDPDDGVPSRWSGDLEGEDDEEEFETGRTFKIKFSRTTEQRLEDRARNSKLKELLQKLGKKVNWDDEEPEGKAGNVFRTGLVLLLIST